MELLDLYDDFGNKLNKTIVRGKVPNDGENIMLSVAYIKNKEGKYLIQKSSKEKGGFYTSTGGHVTHKEDGLITIIRELHEEVGLTNIEDKIKHVKTFKYPNRYCLFDVYLIDNVDTDITKLKLQTEEVESISWLTKEEILELINNGSFLESHAYIFKNYIK